MKVFQINSFGNLSTGSIACGLYKTLNEEGDDGIIAYGRGHIEKGIPNIRVSSNWSILTDGLFSRFTDHAGFFSKAETIKLIKQIETYQPDIVHLHNLHGYYINIELLFQYLKTSGVPVIWTLHDCWAYTGHCCYYSMNQCYKWKVHCHSCKYKKSYPASFVDDSEHNFDRKRNLILSLPNLTLVAVSQWLASEVNKSFLKDIPLIVIQNGIDTGAFKPTASDFRARYGLENKKLILGVASTWDVRKGLYDFMELSKMIDSETSIVLVGLNGKQIKHAPHNVIGLPRTKSVKELAALYSTADVFFNASVEETFGLPTVEAMACGTPVIVYDATALPEVVGDNCGVIVEQHCLENVVDGFHTLTKNKSIIKNCIEQAQKYDRQKSFKSYIRLYQSVLQGVHHEGSVFN